MTPEEITAAVKEIEALDARLEEISLARQKDWRVLLSQDVWRQENTLAKRYNRLVQDLSAAGVEHSYRQKEVYEDESKDTPLALTLFMEGAIDPVELYYREEKPKSKGLVADGLGSLVDY
jgi:hypothetical protein